MSLIIALLIGGLIGWLAAQVGGRDEGLFASIAIGVVGSIIGAFVAGVFGSSSGGYLTFSWPGVLWSFVGAVLLVAILNAVQGGSRHHSY